VGSVVGLAVEFVTYFFEKNMWWANWPCKFVVAVGGWLS